MDIQRIRNLTTGLLHTTLTDIYEDLEYFVSTKGLMTHMLGRVNEAIKPFLLAQLSSHPDYERLMEDAYDPTHQGDIPMRPLTKEECEQALAAYGKLLDPLANKNVMVLQAT